MLCRNGCYYSFGNKIVRNDLDDRHDDDDVLKGCC